jgi:hypothetical protein
MRNAVTVTLSSVPDIAVSILVCARETLKIKQPIKNKICLILK